MNPEALQEAHRLFVETGYDGDINRFKNLISTNQEALQEAHRLFIETGYDGDINRFKNLIGVGQQQPEAPKKKEEDGGMFSQAVSQPFEQVQQDVAQYQEEKAQEQGVQLAPEGTFLRQTQTSSLASEPINAPLELPSKLEERKYEKYKERTPEQMQAEEFEKNILPSSLYEATKKAGEAVRKREEETPEFLKPSIESITDEYLGAGTLYGKKARTIIGDLNQQYQGTGFDFSGRLFDDSLINVTAPNGKTLSVNIGWIYSEKEAAEQLRNFIKENATSIEGLSKLEKEYQEGKQKFINEKNVEESTKLFTQETEDFGKRNALFVKRADELGLTIDELNAIPQSQRNSQEFLSKKQYADNLTNELKVEQKSLLEFQERLQNKETNLKKSIGEYTKFKEYQGGWAGGIWNSMAKTIAAIPAAAYNIGVDIVTEGSSARYLLGEEEYKKQFLQLARDKYNLESDSYESLMRNDDLTQQKYNLIINELKDTVKKERKYGEEGEEGMLPYIRRNVYDFLKDKNTTEQWTGLKNKSTYGQILLGVTGSLPNMLMPGGAIGRAVSTFLSLSDGVFAEMEEDPNFKNIPENEKWLTAAPLAMVGAALEEVGLSSILKNTNLTKYITGRIFSKGIPDFTPSIVKNLVNDEIRELISNNTLKLVNGFLAEAETGALQTLAEYTIKDIYNYSKESKMFDTPNTAAEWITDVLYSGVVEGVGGMMMTAPIAAAESFSRGKFTDMDDVTFTAFTSAYKDLNIEKAFVSSLKNKVAAGEMSLADAKTMLNDYRNAKGLLNLLPEDIRQEDMRQALDLLNERKKLEKKIDGKDPALVKPIQNRINQINEQLTKLSENAVQEQAAGEVPVQSETGVSQEMVEGESQPGLEVTPQEGILTTEENQRKETLTQALSNPENNKGTITIGEELIDRNDAQKELDALLQKEQQQVTPEAAPVQQTETFTEQDRARQQELKDALANADKRRKNITVGETSMPKADVKAEIDALNQKELSSQQPTPEGRQITPQEEAALIEEFFNATRQESRQGKETTTEEKNLVRKAVDNAMKAIGKILPNVNIVIHETNDDYVNATGDTSKASGLYVPKKDGGTIHINLSNANRRTVGHEVFHGILLRGIKNDAEAQRLTKSMINAVMKSLKESGTNQDLLNELEDFVSNYDENIQNEERLAEIFGYLADGYPRLTPPAKNVIQRFLERISKLFGLKPMTDKQVIDFMNTISRKVAAGEEITEKEILTLPKSKNIAEINKRFQANFSDSVSKLSFVYDKNSEDFENLEKQGFITKDKPLSFFNGKYIFLHQPDAAFSGLIYKNGQLLVEGKGGIYYPIKFHKDGYFWASTSKTAKKMADDLNKVMKQNGGVIYMALTSAPNDKLLSSTTMANAILDFFSSKAFDSNFDLKPSQLKEALILAANNIKQKTTKNKKTGKVTVKTVGLNLGLKKNISIDQIQSLIKEKLNPDNSSFEDRKNFAEELIKIMANDIKSNPKSIEQFGKLFSEGIQNKYFKGITKTGKLSISAANMTQALSEMFTEPILKEGVDREKGGQVYAIIELNGKVKPEISDKHESYPMAIKSDGDNKVKLHILTDRQNWYNVFEDFETDDIVSEDRRNKIYPTAGVSVRGLKLNTSKLEGLSPRQQKANKEANELEQEFPSARKQKSKDDLKKIVQAARDSKKFTDAGIREYLKTLGVTDADINDLLKTEQKAERKTELSEKTLPGYTKLMNRINGVIDRSRRRGLSYNEIMDNVINNIEKSPEYVNATDIQREQIIRDIRAMFGKKEKKAPSAEKITGKPKTKKVTVNEMSALKDQIKFEARAAREAKGDLNTKRKMLADAINKMVKAGTITAAQAKTLINRVNKVNLDNPVMVERLIDYADKVFKDADYDTRMQDIRKLQSQARRRKHTSMKDIVKEFTSINPELIPDDKILEYIQALDYLSTRTPSYNAMNGMFSEIVSLKPADTPFDAIKTIDGMVSKWNSINLNEVKSVEDYVNLIRDINSYKKKAYQLLENGVITQDQYDSLMETVGKDQDAVENKYEKELTELKNKLVEDIKNLKPSENDDFSNEENELIKKYLEISESDLKQLSPENLYVLNDILENIKNGEMDYYRFNEIVSKAYTIKDGMRVAKDLSEARFDMSTDEGKRKLSEYESSFWEGVLGLGRVKSGAVQKFIISPFMRAISSYENFLKKGYNAFLDLKKKYNIKEKDMHKLGMLTTYLQEYMAQFDPDNKNATDIGTRDWFKEILEDPDMKSDYPSAKPSIFNYVGRGKSEFDVIKKIWDSLPKDSNGNVDPKAVYESYMANDGKYFTKNEKAFFDATMDWKENNLTSKQKAANELRGNPFKQIAFHMPRVRYDGKKQQIQASATGENGLVRIQAGTGKERTSQKVGAVMTNFEQLFISNLEQTSRDFYLTGALKDINNILSIAKSKLGKKGMPIIKTISQTLSEALSFEFDKNNAGVLNRLLAARAAITLLDPARTAVELISTFVSYPFRSKTIKGYKDIYVSVGKMKELLEFTESPLRLRDNINKAIDINDGKIEPQNKLQKALVYLSGLPERTMMVTSWMPTFNQEFKELTGVNFNMKSFKNSKQYREKYGKAIKEAAAAADAQTEKIIGTTAKAGQRREIRIAPKFLASIAGKQGTVSKNSTAGQILGFFSNYPYREATEFLNGFREAAEVARKGEGVLKAGSQLSKPLGVSFNLITYGYLSAISYALTLILLGDDDDEERGEAMLDDLMTTRGFIDEVSGNAISLAASKYAAGGKAMLQVGATMAMMSNIKEEDKVYLSKILKNSVFLDPLPVEQATEYGGKDKIVSSIGKYVPQLVLAADRYADLVGTKQEIEYIFKKAQENGVESLTEDEGAKVLALNTLINGVQLGMNWKGLSIPMYNKLKTYMRGLKKEAGVEKIKLEPTEKEKAYGGYDTIKDFKENDPEGYTKADNDPESPLNKKRAKDKKERDEKYFEEHGKYPDKKEENKGERGLERESKKGSDRGSDRGEGDRGSER